VCWFLADLPHSSDPRTPSSPAGRPLAPSPPHAVSSTAPLPGRRPRKLAGRPCSSFRVGALSPPARLDKVRSGRHFPMAARISPSELGLPSRRSPTHCSKSGRRSCSFPRRRTASRAMRWKMVWWLMFLLAGRVRLVCII
jgi:hypothetical protein